MRNAFLRSLSLSLTAAALAMVGCSSGPTTNNHPTGTAYIKAPGPEVVPVKPGERMPAQAVPISSAWTNAPINLSILRNSTAFNTQVDVQDITTYSEQVWDPNATTQVLKDVPYPATCNDWVCDGGGAGQSPAWDAFYGAKKGDKATALANAIKGVGNKSAQALIDNGYFHSKPRSWAEFSQAITSAAQSGVIQQSVATETLQQYAADNQENLGYTGGSCHPGPDYPCTKTSQQWVTVSQPGWTTKNFKQPSQDRPYNVNIQVHNVRLLSNESDSLNFFIDPNGQIVDQNNSPTNSFAGTYNHYTLSSQVQGATVYVNLVDDQRFMTALSDNVVQSSDLRMNGGTMTFFLNIDTNYLPTSEDPGSQLVMSYQVWACDRGKIFFSGECSATKPNNRILYTSQNYVMNQSQNQLALDSSKFQGARRIWVVYSLWRQGSQYYSSNPSNHTTGKINLN